MALTSSCSSSRKRSTRPATQTRSPRSNCPARKSASPAVQFLADAFDGKPVARIDPEDFYDFTAVRPTVRLVEGRTRTIEWPENMFSAATVAGADHDLIFVQGVEPSLRWKAYCTAVREVADTLGARMIISLV